jgi:hypothetical protein
MESSPGPAVEPIVESAPIELAPVLDATPAYEQPPLAEATPAMDTEPPISTAPIDQAPIADNAPIFEPTPAPVGTDVGLVGHTEPPVEAAPELDNPPITETAPLGDAAPVVDAAPTTESEPTPVVEAAPVAEPEIQAPAAPSMPEVVETAPANRDSSADHDRGHGNDKKLDADDQDHGKGKQVADSKDSAADHDRGHGNDDGHHDKNKHFDSAEDHDQGHGNDWKLADMDVNDHDAVHDIHDLFVSEIQTNHMSIDQALDPDQNIHANSHQDVSWFKGDDLDDHDHGKGHKGNGRDSDKDDDDHGKGHGKDLPKGHFADVDHDPVEYNHDSSHHHH